MHMVYFRNITTGGQNRTVIDEVWVWGGGGGGGWGGGGGGGGGGWANPPLI